MLYHPVLTHPLSSRAGDSPLCLSGSTHMTCKSAKLQARLFCIPCLKLCFPLHLIKRYWARDKGQGKVQLQPPGLVYPFEACRGEMWVVFWTLMPITLIQILKIHWDYAKQIVAYLRKGHCAVSVAYCQHYTWNICNSTQESHTSLIYCLQQAALIIIRTIIICWSFQRSGAVHP